MQLSVIQCDCCQVTVDAAAAEDWSKFVWGWNRRNEPMLVTDNVMDVCPRCQKAMVAAIERVRLPDSPPFNTAEETIDAVEQRHILSVLERCNWSKSAAAR